MGLVLLAGSSEVGTTPQPLLSFPQPPTPLDSNAVGATNNDLVFQSELLKHGTTKTRNSA